MSERLKETVNKYGLWIGVIGVLLTAGSQMGSCTGGIFGAGATIAKKAEASRVHTLEVQMGKVQECIMNISRRQDRVDRKLDRMDGKLDAILGRKK